MAWAVRINLEHILFRRSEREWESLIQVSKTLKHPIVIPRADIIDHEIQEYFSSAILYIIDLAVCVESFINYCLRFEVHSERKQDRDFEAELTKKNWKEKWKEITEFNPEVSGYGETQLPVLLALRNQFIHYKSGMYFQGYSVESEIQKTLSLETLKKLRSSVHGTLRHVSVVLNLDSQAWSFLNGEFNLLTVDQ